MKTNSPIKNRIQKNLAKLKSWVKSNHIEAYRLYEKDIPEYPFIIDIYKDNAVVYEKGKKLEETPENTKLRNIHIQEVIEALASIFNISTENIHFKQRKVQKGTEQYNHLSAELATLIILENNLKFEVNLSDYLDTGIFLDHRPFRKEVTKMNGQGKFLNLFSYTSSVSVCAAFAGFKTTSIDMSKTYIEWSKRNFALNDFPVKEHQFINANVFDYLENNNDRFDVIFLDPPSFSNSKKMDSDFDVIRDQEKLVSQAMKKLLPNGSLYFSNNARKFKLSSKITEDYLVSDFTLKSIPIDFRDKKIHSLYKINNRDSE